MNLNLYGTLITQKILNVSIDLIQTLLQSIKPHSNREVSVKTRSPIARQIFLGFAFIIPSIVAAAPQLLAQTASPGAIDVPARSIPVPETVSPQMQKIIGAPLRANWNLLPKTGEEWKPVAEAGAAPIIKNVP